MDQLLQIGLPDNLSNISETGRSASLYELSALLSFDDHRCIPNTLGLNSFEKGERDSRGSGVMSAGSADDLGFLVKVKTMGANVQHRKAGRPRLLSLQQIIQAVLAVGVDALSMQKVANSLGVSKAVLYNYVSSRDELVQLAAGHAALSHPFPEGDGWQWEEFVMEYSRALMGFFVNHGQLILAYVQGQFGPLIQTEGAERWLSILTRQGFEGSEALMLQHAVESLILGSALNWIHAQTLSEKGSSYATLARIAVKQRGARELPLLSQHIGTFASKGDIERWEHGVQMLIIGAAKTRQPSIVSR